MKNRIIFTIFAALVLPAAAFKVPSSMLRVDELEKAQAEAAERPELIGILISDEKLQPA